MYVGSKGQGGSQPDFRLLGAPDQGLSFYDWRDLAYVPILWFCHAARPGLSQG